MSIVSTVENDVVSVLEFIGKEFEKGLTFAVKYLPEASVIAGFVFPAAVAPLAEATSAADLLQNAIALTEQKYAASGVQSGTGAQKAAEVLTLANSAVTTLLSDATVQSGLKAAGISVNTSYINRLVSAIVSILNVQGVVTPAAA